MNRIIFISGLTELSSALNLPFKCDSRWQRQIEAILFKVIVNMNCQIGPWFKSATFQRTMEKYARHSRKMWCDILLPSPWQVKITCVISIFQTHSWHFIF